MIAVVDYGMGNLRSAQKALERVGHPAVVTDDPTEIERADAVVLPGVGAFADCYVGLEQRGLMETIVDAMRSGKPFLGICVGLQLLFEQSEEGRGARGLGVFAGRVVRFPDAAQTGLKVPHMGWNRVKPTGTATNPILEILEDEPYMYFVHSYYAAPCDTELILATSEYGMEFPAVVGRDNVFAVQFHPEKSQRKGLALLETFGNLIKGG